MRDGPRRSGGKPPAGAAHVLYCDGASLGNPGPAGAGFVLVSPTGETQASGSVPLGTATNNVAEYRALIAGLHRAAALRVRRLVVRADSELLVRQMSGGYRVRAPHLKPLHEWARKLVGRFDEVRFESVPREANSEADRLAKEAAERARSRRPA